MKRISLLALVAWLEVGAVLLVVGGAGAPPAEAQSETGGWAERAQLLLPRSEMSIAELNGRIYALGGYPGARITSDAVQV